MNFYEVTGNAYISTYTRTDLTDSIHDVFGFKKDYEIVTSNRIKKILNGTQKSKYYTLF